MLGPFYLILFAEVLDSALDLGVDVRFGVGSRQDESIPAIDVVGPNGDGNVEVEVLEHNLLQLMSTSFFFVHAPTPWNEPSAHLRTGVFGAATRKAIFTAFKVENVRTAA